MTLSPQHQHFDAEIYALNLDSSPERWQQLQQGAERLGIDLRRFPAVLGRTLTPAEKAQHTTHLGYHRPLTDGEVGCYLSHLKCLEHFIAQSNKAFVLIVEDDIQLNTQLLPIAAAAMAQNMAGSEWGLLKLSGTKRNARFCAAITETFAVVEFNSVPATTLAQVWTRAAAQQFIAGYAGCKRPIDVDLRFTWEHQLKIRVVFPPLVAALDIGSTIGGARNRSKHHLKKLRYNFNFLQGRLRCSVQTHGWLATLRGELGW